MHPIYFGEMGCALFCNLSELSHLFTYKYFDSVSSCFFVAINGMRVSYPHIGILHMLSRTDVCRIFMICTGYKVTLVVKRLPNLSALLGKFKDEKQARQGFQF